MSIGSGIVRAAGVKMRRLPDEASPVLHALPAGTELEVVRQRVVAGRSWIRLRHADKREGWITEDDAGFCAFHEAVIADDAAELRAAPGDSSSKPGRLPHGSTVTVLRSRDDPDADWTQVRTRTGRRGLVRSTTVVVWDTPTGDGGGAPGRPDLDARRPRGRIALTTPLVGALARGLRFLAGRGDVRGKTAPIGRLPPS